jgi:hypothetical protein
LEPSAESPPFPAALDLSPAEGRARAVFEVSNLAGLPLVARFAASTSATIAPRAMGLSAGARQRVVLEIDSPAAGCPEKLSVSWRRLGRDREALGHSIALRLRPAATARHPASNADDATDCSLLALFEDLHPTGEGSWSGRDLSLGSFRGQEIRRVPADDGHRERATALLGFEDPAIARLRKWLEEEGALYLVTDAPAGEPLQDWASRTWADLTPAAVADLGWGIAVALGLLHAAGIPHGALSPATVSRTTDGRLQLHGFSLDPAATPAGDARDAAALLLTLVPPEVWWAADAAQAFLGVDSVAALYRAIQTLGQAAPATQVAIPPADLEPSDPTPDLLHTSDLVIGAHETAEAEAAPELDVDTALGHVPIELTPSTLPSAVSVLGGIDEPRRHGDTEND